MKNIKTKYMIKASKDAIDFIKRNNLAKIMHTSTLVKQLYIIESELEKDFFKDTIGVESVEENYKGTLNI